MTELAGNTALAPPVYAGMKLCSALACWCWPPRPLVAGCVVSVDSQGQIVREEKRFTVDRHAGAPPHHFRRFDRDPVLGQDRRAGRDREARSDARGGRRARCPDVARTAPDRARGQAAARRRASAASASIVSASAKLIVSVPRRANIVAQQRRRLDQRSNASTAASSCGPATAASVPRRSRVI